MTYKQLRKNYSRGLLWICEVNRYNKKQMHLFLGLTIGESYFRCKRICDVDGFNKEIEREEMCEEISKAVIDMIKNCKIKEGFVLVGDTTQKLDSILRPSQTL